MAAVDVAARPAHERTSRRKPFTQWMKSLANLKHKGGDQQDKTNGKPLGKSYMKKSSNLRTKKDGTLKNNPYPQSSAHLQLGQSPVSSRNGPLSIATATSRPQHSHGSEESLERGSTCHDREAQSASNKSGAPTLATNPETVHSDAGNSKAATVATHGGALSDGIGHDSTFSSPSQSQHSLTTTLTTIQSTSAGNVLGSASPTNTTPTHHGSLNNPNPVMFSHQYPVSPGPSIGGNAISAIPRHLTEPPNTYERATANGLLTDNASILTLASSSKRHRRSIESQTDASVRALAPSSVWGGSRESLPLSVLSGNADREASSSAAGGGGPMYPSQPRRSIGGLASAERASVYSSSGGVTAPALASERNSYYSHSHSHKPTKDLAGDAKSLRSITNIDARSQQYDARSINTDARSLVDVASLKNYEGSVRSGALGHGRQDSFPGSGNSPVTPGAGAGPGGAVRQLSTGGGQLSRRSSDWQREVEKEGDAEDDGEKKKDD